MKTPKQKLAAYLGMSFEELNDYRYHYGRTNIPVYAIGDNYYCCVKSGNSPAKHHSMGFDWVLVDNDSYQVFQSINQ